MHISGFLAGVLSSTIRLQDGTTMDEKHHAPDIRISLFPRPVVIVTAVNTEGEVGATTISWTGILSSRPPVISASFLPDSFTRRLIMDSREFVVNVPTHDMWMEANYLGSVSGPWEMKLEGLRRECHKSLTLIPSRHIRAPQIAEAYLALECRTLNTIQIGLYDCFMGQVLATTYNSALFCDDHPRGRIDYAKVSPLICLADEYWCTGSKLGLSTENKNHPHGTSH